jgi:hypothetical protein
MSPPQDIPARMFLSVGIFGKAVKDLTSGKCGDRQDWRAKVKKAWVPVPDATSESLGRVATGRGQKSSPL